MIDASPSAILPLACGLLLSAAGMAADGIRIVDCSEPVRSAKRGVCVNQLEEADFAALSPGVSWWYNWGPAPNQPVPPGTTMEFIPMAWGDDPSCLNSVQAYLATGAKPSRILAINEPNLKGQAFITPEETARLLARVRAVAQAAGVPVVGPHMALGSPPGDSITAMDPIEKKQLTYTYMMPFLKAFIHYSGDAPAAPLGVHAYGNIHELRWMVGELDKEFHRPVWVTEFSLNSPSGEAAALEHLVQAVDCLERSPSVERYAWFKERSGVPLIGLLEQAPGQLSRLGRAYLAMPVHDPALHYRIPGRLEAERYTAMHGVEVMPTSDDDGFIDLAASSAFPRIDYQVQTEAEGDWRMVMRVGGTDRGNAEIGIGDQVLAETSWQGRVWQESAARVRLPAGPVHLRVRLASGVRLNWIRFERM